VVFWDLLNFLKHVLSYLRHEYKACPRGLAG